MFPAFMIPGTTADPGRPAERRPPRKTGRSRARQQQQQRAEVERIALELFREHGFNPVTVERIAGEAGVGPSTFYRYFGTKYGVLFAAQSQFLQAARDACLALDPNQPRPRQVRDLLFRIAGLLDPDLDAMRLRDDIVHDNPELIPAMVAVERAWEEELTRSLAVMRGCSPEDLTSRTDAALSSVVIRIAFRCWRKGDCATLTEAVGTTLAAAASGLTGGGTRPDATR
jgi:AcrR family transcriptional regulator